VHSLTVQRENRFVSSKGRMGGVGLLTGLPELDPEPGFLAGAGAEIFTRLRFRLVQIVLKFFTNFSPKYFLSTLNY